MTQEQAYHDLCCYTLAHGDPAFIHQHVVDAYAAQHADEKTKPIALTFALAGLYLHIEKEFSGKRAQQAHMALARHKQRWPSFSLPQDRGAMTAGDVLVAREGRERDQAIHAWCASVWDAFRENRSTVVELLRARGIT